MRESIGFSMSQKIILWVLGALSAPFFLGAGVSANQAVPIVELDRGQQATPYNPAVSAPATVTRPAAAAVSKATANPADLLYQLEILQQEVQSLRGIVEQQAYDIQRMREEQRDRYIDLDRRISLINKSGAAAEQPASVSPNVTGNSGNVEKGAYQQALKLIRNKQYEQGVEAFSQYLKDYPQGDYAANSYYFLGEVQLLQGNREEALKAFGALLNRAPEHRKVPDAKLKLGKVYAELGETAKAKALWQQVVKDYPNSSQARLADIQLSKNP